MQKKIILIDIDDVIADFEKAIVEKVKENNWEFEKNIGMYTQIKDDNDYKKKFSIIQEKNFFLDFEPIKNSVKYVKEIIADKNFEVFFCSAPTSFYKNFVLEKYLWIEKYFGFEMTKKIILTRDKTLIKADYLIDDNPEIEGLKKPEWEQIFFTQSYNKNYAGKRIDKWEDLKKVLK